MNIRYRHEFKYPLTVHQAMMLEHLVRQIGLERDPSTPAGETSYPVTSLYFDTLDLACYHEKMGGLLHRKKVRLRGYRPNLAECDRLWLEVKHKTDTLTGKTRAILTRDQARAFLRDGRTGVEQFPEDVRRSLYERPLRPWLLVRYKRRAYLDRMDQCRITFDYDLETTESADLHNTRPCLSVRPQQVLVEVKFRTLLPEQVAQFIRAYQLERITHSKYTLCADAVRAFEPIAH